MHMKMNDSQPPENTETAEFRLKSEAALRVAAPLLEEPVADRRNWTIPRLRAEIEAREGVSISRSQLSKALRKKKLRWRRPRHTLKGRQTESEVERVGLRLRRCHGGGGVGGNQRVPEGGRSARPLHAFGNPPARRPKRLCP